MITGMMMKMTKSLLSDRFKGSLGPGIPGCFWEKESRGRKKIVPKISDANFIDFMRLLRLINSIIS